MFGHEADYGKSEAEVGDLAKNDQPDPDISEDAVFETADEADDDDLRQVDEGCGRDTHGKRGDGAAQVPGLLAAAKQDLAQDFAPLKQQPARRYAAIGI